MGIVYRKQGKNIDVFSGIARTLEADIGDSGVYLLFLRINV